MSYYYPNSSGQLPAAEKSGVYGHPLGAQTIDPRLLGPAGLPVQGGQVPASLGYAQQGSPSPSQQLAAQQAYSQATQQAYAQQMAYGAQQGPAVSSAYAYGPPHGGAASLYGQPSGLPYHVASLASPNSPYLSSQSPTMGAVRVPVATTAPAAYQTSAAPMFGYSGFGGQPMYAPSMYGASVMTPQPGTAAGLYPTPVGMTPAPGYPAAAMYSSRPRPSN